MNLRTSLVLMVLFLGLGYFAFFEPLRTAPKEEEKTERDTHVVWLKDQKLAGLELRGTKGSVAFACANKEKACPPDAKGQWVLTAPLPTAADPATVGALAGLILNLTHNGKVDFPQGYNPKEFGLDQPKVELTLHVVGRPDSPVLRFGGPSAVGPNTYLSVSDDPHHLFLVPTYLLSAIDQDLFHWRDKRLFPGAEATAVSGIHWHSPKLGEVSAVRDGKGWRLVKPRAVGASPILFEGLGSILSYAAAKSVFAEDRSSAAGKSALHGAPELEVHFTLNGGGEHVLRVFPKERSPHERLVLVDSLVPVYVIGDNGLDRFGKDLSEYRRRSLLTESERSGADEVHFRFPREKKETTLRLEHGNWEVKDGAKPAAMLSQARINGFLDQLRDADYKAPVPANGPSPEARAWRAGPIDLEVEVKSAGQIVGHAAYFVFDRRQALTEGEGEVRHVGGDAFVKILPVRFDDLTRSADRTVVLQKEDAHGEYPQPKSAK